MNDAQAAEWTRDRRVQMITRPLVYPGWTAATRHLPQQRPYEKGIDVAIAVDMMHFAFRMLYDALILFSSDTDLMPPLETITSLGLTHVEVACWRGGSQLVPGYSPALVSHAERAGLERHRRRLEEPRLVSLRDGQLAP